MNSLSIKNYNNFKLKYMNWKIRIVLILQDTKPLFKEIDNLIREIKNSVKWLTKPFKFKPKIIDPIF